MNDLIHQLTIIYIEKSVDTTNFSEDDFVKLYLKSYQAIKESYNQNHVNDVKANFFKDSI
ncbi:MULTISPECIES: hypothetical protein [Helcococcus]|uniref:Phage protein n=1 Tax=Helcococcus bovis TaxID=3153252 RepID=A0ABW9F705_9FIRM